MTIAEVIVGMSLPAAAIWALITHYRLKIERRKRDYARRLDT